MTHKLAFTSLFSLLFFIGINSAAQENIRQWTHFRGNNLNGIVESGFYPTNWSDTANVAWKTEIRGRAWSSPVIHGDQVWCTSATEDGKEMFAVCIDYYSGEILREVLLFEPDSVFRIHPVNSYATPTPAIERGRVYVHFGRYGTACLDTRTGEKIWERTDLRCEHVQGPGSSLFIYDEKLIVHMEGTDRMRIYALDKSTGETIWTAERNEKWYEGMLEIGRKAYVTPIVIEVDGRKLLISNGSGVCNAFDVNTGEEVWYIPQGEDSTISMPVESNGIIYFYTSFITPETGDKYCELFAVDPRGTGDLSGNILWRVKSPILQLLTPVVHFGFLYTVDSNGQMYCLDAKNGRTVWTMKLKGKFHSSPILANKHIYINSTRGETYVFIEGEYMELVAENKLEGEIWSTPAFVDGTILMRTSKYLYKIE